MGHIDLVYKFYFIVLMLCAELLTRLKTKENLKTSKEKTMLDKTKQELLKIHTFYMDKFKSYNTWHKQPNSSKIHKFIVVLFAFFSFFSALYIMPFSPIRTKAAGNYYVSANGTANWSSCTSPSTPCSVVTANSNYVGGDNIYLLGNFNSRVIFSRSGSSIANVNILSYNGRVRFNDGVTLSGSYINLSGFDIGPMNGQPASVFMVDISGSYNTVTDFRAGNDGSNGLPTLTGGSLVGFTGSAHHNRASDFQGTDIPWCGAEFQPQSHDNILGGNFGIRDSFIHGFGDNVAIGNQDGTNNWIDGGNGWLDITGEGYAHDAGGWQNINMNDGDGIKPYGINNGVRKTRIYKLYQAGPSSHTDAIQFQGHVGPGSVVVQNYIIENCVFGSYFRARPTAYVPNQADMPHEYIMMSAGPSGNASIVARNNIFLGDSDGYNVFDTNDGNYPPYQVILNVYNNTFITQHTPIRTYGLVANSLVGEVYNNIIFGTQGQWDGQGAGNLNWHHNLFKKSSDAVGTSNVIALDPMFVNGDVSAANNFGLNSDFHLKPGSPAIGKGYNGADIGAFPYTSGSGNPDTTSPTVSLSSPANNATVSGTVAISATASDNIGVVRVEFAINGNTVNSDTTSPYSYNWDSTTIANGTVIIRARAYDAAGNYTEVTRTVTVNNTTAPPSCTTGNGDVNKDGRVNISDAAILMAKWGQTVTNDPSDINCDSKVNISDAAILMAHWGT